MSDVCFYQDNIVLCAHCFLSEDWLAQALDVSEAFRTFEHDLIVSRCCNPCDTAANVGMASLSFVALMAAARGLGLDSDQSERRSETSKTLRNITALRQPHIAPARNSVKRFPRRQVSQLIRTDSYSSLVSPSNSK